MRDFEREKVKRCLPSLMSFIWGIGCITLIFYSPRYACIVFLIGLILPLAESIIALRRAHFPLYIPTPDGSNEPFHPSVRYFPKKFCGFHYWMAFTPFPVKAKPYPDRWECPCVVVSQDGLHWEYPGEKVFLDDLTQQQITDKGYFSDPHLVFDEIKGTLCLYYRLNEKYADKIKIFVIFSRDGINWTSRRECNFSEDLNEALRLVSPAVVKHENVWQMWFVSENHLKRGQGNICYCESEDGINWGKSSSVTLDGLDNIHPWHIDVENFNGLIYLCIYDRLADNISLWYSIKDNINSFKYLKTLLTASHCLGSFFSERTYRTCMIQNIDRKICFFFSSGNYFRNTIGILTSDLTSTGRTYIIRGSFLRGVQNIIMDIIWKYTHFEICLIRRIIC